MSRYADGQDSAFGEVYDLLAPRLYGFFVRHTGETSRAEDLVQQTMLQMHAARTSFALGSDAVPWAFAIGRRLLIDSRRRTRKEVLFETAQDDAAALAAEVVGTTEAAIKLRAHRAYEALRAALASNDKIEGKLEMPR